MVKMVCERLERLFMSVEAVLRNRDPFSRQKKKEKEIEPPFIMACLGGWYDHSPIEVDPQASMAN